MIVPPLVVENGENVITQESAVGGGEPKPRLWLIFTVEVNSMFGRSGVMIQGGVVSSLNLDPREPSWLG